MKQQIKRLEDPSLKCCQLVYEELIRILGQLLGKIVSLCFCTRYKERGFHLLCLAIFQAVPRATRKVQQRRCQLLQGRHGTDDKVGVGYGLVSVENECSTGMMSVDGEIGCKHVM